MDTLTKTQIEAIRDDSRFLAITAGAGSGKTRVIVERISNILEKKLASLNEILAITFTEKASAELRSRICKTIDDETAIANSHIGTFHSFCASILREHAPLVGVDPDFSVMEEHSAGILVRSSVKETILKLLEEKNEHAILLIEELDFKDALACVEDLMRYRWHVAEKISPPKADPPPAEDFKFQISDPRENNLRKAVLHCFNEANKVYSKLKGIDLDFQDLEIFALKLLENKEVRGRYQKRFKYILVDEFQDVNNVQAKLIALIHDPKTNFLTIVGDPKQSIYRFRGANVNEFDKAINRANKTIRLQENFRSRPEILSFINFVFPDFSPLVPDKTSKSLSVSVLDIDSAEDEKMDSRRQKEAVAIAEITSNLKGTTACLFSSLKSSHIYKKAFAELNIPFVVHGGGGLLESQEIIDIVNALRVAKDRSDLVALIALARSPFIGLSDEELFVLCKNNKNGLFDIIKDHPKGGFLKTLEETSTLLSISELINFIGGRSDNVRQFCHIASAIEEREKISLGSFLDYISHLRSKEASISEYPMSSDSAVMLMTIHQAKGLEFDNVFLADTIRPKKNSGQKWCFLRGENSGIAFKLLPENNPEADPVPTEFYEELRDKDKKEESAERDRLLYVAMTRARENLIIPIHKHAKRDGDWHKLLKEKCLGMPVRPEPVEGQVIINRDITSSWFDKPVLSELILRQAQDERVEALTMNGKFLDTPFTVSELETFERSPDEYHQRYVLQTPELPIKFGSSETLPANVHGDIVHRMIEITSKYKMETAKLFEDLCVEMAISDVTQKEREDIIGKVGSYIKSPYAGQANAQNEVPFLMQIGEHFIKGQLDMLVIDPDGSWEIVDFKTGHSENPENYDLQAKAYALAVSKKHGHNGKVTLLFLEPNAFTTSTVNIDEKILAETEKRLDKICSQLSS